MTPKIPYSIVSAMFTKEGGYDLGYGPALSAEGVVWGDVETLITSVIPMPEGNDSFVAGQIRSTLPTKTLKADNRFALAQFLQWLGVNFSKRAEAWETWPGYTKEGVGKTYREELAFYKAAANTLETSIDLYDPNADQLPLVATSYLICVIRALRISQKKAQKLDEWQISKVSKVKEVREFVNSLVGKGIKVEGVEQKIVEQSLKIALDITDEYETS